MSQVNQVLQRTTVSRVIQGLWCKLEIEGTKDKFKTVKKILPKLSCFAIKWGMTHKFPIDYQNLPGIFLSTCKIFRISETRG